MIGDISGIDDVRVYTFDFNTPIDGQAFLGSM